MNFKFILLINFFEAEGIELPGGFLEKVIPNLWSFLVQLIAFIVMVLIFMKFAYKPVKKFLDARREYIEKNIKEAGDKNLEAEENLQKSKETIISSKKEATDIVSKAKVEATKQRAAILESANNEINLNKQKAKDEIKIEKEKALKEVHDQVVNLAIETSKSVLGREINEKDNAKMINELIDSLEEKK